MAIDPDEFRDTQRAAWSSVAAGWRSWWHVFENGAKELNARLVEAAGIERGERVLDVATGIGEPALTAAARVGAEGSVLGVDLSPGMLELARVRASEAGFTNAEFIERDAEQLDLEPGSFDAALSRWGLMLMLHPERSAAGIRAALRPGARLAASVWAEQEEVPFLATPGRVAREVLGLEAPDPDAPGPFRFAREGALDALLRSAGFADLENAKVPVTMEFESDGRYADFVLELSSSMKKTLADRTDAECSEVRRAIERAAEPYTDTNGRVVFENQAWLVRGTR